jgi:hypothetical protein
MTERRWFAEIELVEKYFSHFTPFQTETGIVGFAGVIRGRRRNYQVLIKVLAAAYPATEPKIYMDPHPEGHHWIQGSGELFLCYVRDNYWNPAKSTFANCILIGVKYVAAFD